MPTTTTNNKTTMIRRRRSLLRSNNNNGPNAYVTCGDGHRCYHGSTCVEHVEGSFSCDCSQIPEYATYDGVGCEHQATQYCTIDNHVSAEHYCTNQGICLKLFRNEAQHKHAGCECPDSYFGPHCQFVADQTVPDDWPGVAGTPVASPTDAAATASLSGIKNEPQQQAPPAGTIVASALAGIVMLAVLISFFLIRERRKQVLLRDSGNENAASAAVAANDLRLDESTTAAKLEADGQVLQKAIADEAQEAATVTTAADTKQQRGEPLSPNKAELL